MKFKDTAFVAGVDREDVRNSYKELGVDLAEHIQFINRGDADNRL
jgi:predicted hydrolase (HD superfamily)